MFNKTNTKLTIELFICISIYLPATAPSFANMFLAAGERDTISTKKKEFQKNRKKIDNHQNDYNTTGL